MDFFSAQDHARRTTRLLVLWFALAVVGLIASVYLGIAVAMRIAAVDPAVAPPPLWNTSLLVMVAIGVGGFILVSSLYKIISLSRGGGATIAEELGGRLVTRSSNDLRERRLINVVDEMAIAAGIPSPPVYILDAESGINAFAAGARPAEAVVAVTRGTLEQLSRDELQGVVAHEFSHILNGDMRLNLRLLGVLHGILLLTLAGRTMLRGARHSGRNGAPLVAAGVVLTIGGYVGVLFGKLIKAGVSRQREYLADASAVQYTRNPAGIAGALARIGGIGSQVMHPRAEEASHMFFGSSANFSRLMATHPPIDDRIRRIDPSFLDRETREYDTPAEILTDAESPLSSFAPAPAPAEISAEVGTFSPEQVAESHALITGLPGALADALHRPRGARATLFALLLSPQMEARDLQLADIEERFGEDARTECTQFARLLGDLPPGSRLPVLDLTLPTLTEFTHEARQELIEVADKLIRADGRTSAFEYVTRRLLHAVLIPERSNILPAMVAPATLRRDTGRLLAMLARAGQTDDASATAAFAAAAAAAPLDGNWHLGDIPESITTIELDRILATLSVTKPMFRRKLVEACATAVVHDGVVAVQEIELLRAVCQALDCPLPLLEVRTASRLR